jgi:hypothetical protein
MRKSPVPASWANAASSGANANKTASQKAGILKSRMMGSGRVSILLTHCLRRKCEGSRAIGDLGSPFRRAHMPDFYATKVAPCGLNAQMACLKLMLAF